MKFTYAVAVFLGIASAAEPVWTLRSVNDHRTDSTIQAAYGEHSIKQANARPPYQSAMQMEESDSESDSSDDEALVQTEGYFKPGFSGTIGAAEYKRVTPERFSSDDDDIFMRSMIQKYALEAQNADGAPAGAFWMDKFAAESAAKEVLCTHKKICDAELATYLDTYFSKAWGHFDVNQTGYVEVTKMPMFIRFLASDQYFQFIQPPKK
jgi:hypothetical protein